MNAPPKLKPHPLAQRMPPMLTDEYADLLADIKAHGLRQPIVLFEGKVLDGLNRLRACDDAGVEPRTEEFTGTKAEAEAFVLSLNVHRRHLTFEQRQKLVHVELERDPTQSDRSIAKKAKVNPHVVAKARAKSNVRDAHKTDRKEASGRAARGAKPKATTTPEPASKKADTTTPAAPKPSATKPKPDADIKEQEAVMARAEAAFQEAVAALPEATRVEFERVYMKAHAGFHAGISAIVNKRITAVLADEVSVIVDGDVRPLSPTLLRRLHATKAYRNEAKKEATKIYEFNVRNAVAEAVKAERKNKLDEWMTLDEFRLVRGCLHPDQADRSKVSLNKAFDIFNRLERHVSDKKADRKKNGWDAEGGKATP